MHLCCFSLITADKFQSTNRYRYQFVGEVITDILSTKEITERATRGGNEKMQFLFLLLLALTF